MSKKIDNALRLFKQWYKSFEDWENYEDDVVVESLRVLRKKLQEKFPLDRFIPSNEVEMIINNSINKTYLGKKK